MTFQNLNIKNENITRINRKNVNRWYTTGLKEKYLSSKKINQLYG